MAIKLTAKENQALTAIVENALQAMGGDQPSDLHDDNFSWFDLNDITKAGFSKHAASGLISALNEKGLIGYDGEGCWFLEADGIDAAQAIHDEATDSEE